METTATTMNPAGLLSRWLGFWNWAISTSDPRIANWLFMDSPWPTVTLTLAYLLGVCWLGPKIMANRKPFDLRVFMVVYNFAMVALSVYMWVNLLIGGLRRDYNWVCQGVTPYDSHPEEMRIVDALWWFYFSKFIEFTDTIIFVLRKKTSQVTFLHVYHHTTMFPLWWIGIKWVAGGNSALPALVNSLVHTLMYSYYGLSAAGNQFQPYLWWKRYLTKLQLLQFFIALAVAVYSLAMDCDFPKWMHYALLFYALSLILLFLNFYVKAYLQGKNGKSAPTANGKKHK